jgi:hypothetical protein
MFIIFLILNGFFNPLNASKSAFIDPTSSALFEWATYYHLTQTVKLSCSLKLALITKGLNTIAIQLQI